MLPKAGILNTDLDVVSSGFEEEGDWQNVCMEVQRLIEKIMPADGRFTVDEYERGDDDLPDCMEFDNDTWEAYFMDQLLEEADERGEEEVEGGKRMMKMKWT